MSAATIPSLPPSLPVRGETREARAEADDQIMWSVTTILSVLDKPALIPWAVGDTAERTVKNLHVVQARIRNEGPDSAVEYIKGLRWHTDGLLKTSELGTLAHALFNEYALTGTRPAVTADLHPKHASDRALLDDRDMITLRRMLDQFDRFLQEWQPDYRATEVVVYHADTEGPDGETVPGYGIAGQLDGIAAMGGQELLLDYKTTRDTWTKAGKVKGPYPEASLQVAAYRHCTHAAIWRARRYENRSRRYYLLNATERAAAVPVPQVDGGVIVHVTPDRYGVYPARCGPEQWQTFLFCLEVARWSFNEAKHAIGNEMTPPHPMPPDESDPFAGLPT